MPGTTESLEPCAPETTITLWVCRDRGVCADSNAGRTLLDQETVDMDGNFTLTFNRSQVTDSMGEYPALLLAEATLDGVTYRALFEVDESGMAANSDVTPDSEAAVRLMVSANLDRFGFDDVANVNSAVVAANADLDFTGLTPANAASEATSNAAADPNVQAALNAAPTPIPAKTFSDGCSVVPGQPAGGVLALATFPLGLLWWRRARRKRPGCAASAPSPPG